MSSQSKIPIIDSHIHLFAQSHLRSLAWTADLPADHVLNRGHTVQDYKQAWNGLEIVSGFVFLETDRISGLQEDQWKEAMTFWRDTGTGMSTRNAPFCLEELDYLESKSPNPAFQTPASRERSSGQVSQCLASVRSVAASIPVVKSFIAQMVTSEQQGQPAVNPGEVFLYPNGTNAIYSLSQTLASPSRHSTRCLYTVR